MRRPGDCSKSVWTVKGIVRRKSIWDMMVICANLFATGISLTRLFPSKGLDDLKSMCMLQGHLESSWIGGWYSHSAANYSVVFVKLSSPSIFSHDSDSFELESKAYFKVLS